MRRALAHRGGGRRAVVVCTSILLASLVAGAANAQEEGAAATSERPPTARQRQILRSIVKQAPWRCPDGWIYELGTPARRGELLRARMLDTASWPEFVAYAVLLDWSDRACAETVDRLLEGLSGSQAAKTRQSVIFLTAMVARNPFARLRPLFAGEVPSATEDDRRDAGCALAMLGDAEAIAWFEQEMPATGDLAWQPMFRFTDYRRLEEEAPREQLRAYRAWEVLFGRSYFHRLQYLGHADIFGLRRTARDEPARLALAERLLPLFPVKWPGHPGSDDFAKFLFETAAGRGDLVASFRWAQRATLLPDQDCRGSMVLALRALAESQLSLADLDAVLDSPDGELNRAFLEYTRFLALARTDLGAALDWLAARADAEPGGLFAHARKLAAHVAIPDGLRNGLDADQTRELVLGYVERSRGLDATATAPPVADDGQAFLDALSYDERQILRRMRPARRDTVPLGAGEVAGQLRVLLELHHLEQLEAKSADPDEQADLRYRRASIVYENPDAFFPVWASHTMNYGYALNRVRFGVASDVRLRGYVGKALHLRRAYDLYASIVEDFADYEGVDRALFSMGKCYAQLMDYRPAQGVDVWCYPDAQPADPGLELEHAHGRVAALFGRVVEEHPLSTLADDAARAKEYREGRVRALRREREREDRRVARRAERERRRRSVPAPR